MRSIKYKILVNFCLTATVIITVLGAVVSWKLNQSISQQSKTLAHDVIAQTYKTLDGHHEILKSFIHSIEEDAVRKTTDLCDNPVVRTTIESQLLDSLEGFLKSRLSTTEIDFALIYDLKGTLQASFPGGVDKGWMQNYYQSWKLGLSIQNLLKGGSQAKTVKLVDISKHDSQFIKACGLDDRALSAKGGLSIAAAGIVTDSSDAPLGICICGKLLNRYDKPMQQLYLATGSAGAVYLDTDPIAQAGFNSQGKEGQGETRLSSDLRIDFEMQKKIFEAQGPEHLTLTLAQEPYLTTSSAITSASGEKMGFICVGIPESKIIKAQQYGTDTKKNVQVWILGIGIVSLIIFVAISLLITRSITAPLLKSISTLNKSADKVTFAAGQISSISRSLTEGATAQASGLDETSSSMREMSAMTRQNAGNANKAEHLMAETSKVVENTNASVVELTNSMEEISKVSNEVSKIIKTIDEIAFQTNLLSLNAAVEAARAGDVGSGFAVVADEVRRLAMRSAEAAKNTAELIEDTVNKIRVGSDIVSRTNEAFSKVAESAKKVNELIGEIAAASNEQAGKVDQVNRAVNEIHKITQQNTMNAESSALAFNEMNAQAGQLKGISGELMGLVVGNSRISTISGPILPRSPSASTPHSLSISPPVSMPVPEPNPKALIFPVSEKMNNTIND